MVAFVLCYNTSKGNVPTLHRRNGHWDKGRDETMSMNLELFFCGEKGRTGYMTSFKNCLGRGRRKTQHNRRIKG